MKIICFKEGKENKAVLSDGHRPILTNWYESISDVYDFADWASNKYNTGVSVEFRKQEEMYYDKHSYYIELYAVK